jgi:hypothetical protein
MQHSAIASLIYIVEINDFKIEETNCYLYLYDRYVNRNLEESWFSSGKFLLQGELVDNDTKREPIILVLDDEMLVCELLFLTFYYYVCVFCVHFNLQFKTEYWFLFSFISLINRCSITNIQTNHIK